MVLIAEGIPGLDFLETYRGANVSCLDEIDRVLLVGEHLHDTADTLFPAASYVQYIRTCIQVTAITPEEGQTTYERIGHDLESQCSKGFFCICFTMNSFTGIGIEPCNVLNIQRRRQVTANGIKCSLHPFIFERRTAHHRNDPQVHRSLTDGLLHLIFPNLFRIFEHFLYHILSIPPSTF